MGSFMIKNLFFGPQRHKGAKGHEGEPIRESLRLRVFVAKKQTK
jgi:hypothetical protein